MKYYVIAIPRPDALNQEIEIKELIPEPDTSDDIIAEDLFELIEEYEQNFQRAISLNETQFNQIKYYNKNKTDKLSLTRLLDELSAIVPKTLDEQINDQNSITLRGHIITKFKGESGYWVCAPDEGHLPYKRKTLLQLQTSLNKS